MNLCDLLSRSAKWSNLAVCQNWWAFFIAGGSVCAMNCAVISGGVAGQCPSSISITPNKPKEKNATVHPVIA
jgi:hypothetical protein